MLNEEIITPLSYDSFISPVSRRLRERACALSTGARHHFKGKFPFSWIIKDVVSVLLLQVFGECIEKAIVYVYLERLRCSNAADAHIYSSLFLIVCLLFSCDIKPVLKTKTISKQH